MSQIRKEYTKGHMTKCMQLIYEEFQKNFWNFQRIDRSKKKAQKKNYFLWNQKKESAPSLVHKCQRGDSTLKDGTQRLESKQCPCARFGHYIICIAAC